jgi:hypothetical protein
LYYGLYKTGSILYFGIKYTYIIPFNGRCVAYTPDENRRVTMVIAKTSDIYHTNILGELAKSDESNTYVLGDYKTLSARNESITNNYVIGNDVDANDHGYKLHLIYGATASPSERQYQTVNDSPEAITFSWEMTTTPVAVPGFKPTACLTIDSTKADATKLKALEDILYGTNAGEGTEATEARLPLPEEVITLMKTA